MAPAQLSFNEKAFFERKRSIQKFPTICNTKPVSGASLACWRCRNLHSKMQKQVKRQTNKPLRAQCAIIHDTTDSEMTMHSA